MLNERTALSKQYGFTLIELVMVIVILGILAAFALPRFADLRSNSNIAALQGIGGAIKSAASIVHSKAIVKGVQDLEEASIDLDGVDDIKISYGYPTADRGPTYEDPNNLFSAMDPNFGSDLIWGTNGDETFVVITTSAIQGSSGGRVNRKPIEDTKCYVKYLQATSPGASPKISYVTDDC